MSTSYATRISPAELAEVAHESGWFPLPMSDCAIYSDGENYAHADFDCKVLVLTRYGQNCIEDFVDALGAVSEHDPEFDEICGYDD